MPIPPPKKHETDFKVRLDREQRRLYGLAAKQRGVSTVEWIRRVCNEELERQAALVLYELRIQRPHEINAIVEELLRQRTVTDESTAETE